MEPPSYNEAILNQANNFPPPSYEEAMNAQPTPYTVQDNVDNRGRQGENSSMNRLEASTVVSDPSTGLRSIPTNRSPLNEGLLQVSVNSMGQPYTSHRPHDRTSEV
jgi:hypothetical protein